MSDPAPNAAWLRGLPWPTAIVDADGVVLLAGPHWPADTVAGEGERLAGLGQPPDLARPWTVGTHTLHAARRPDGSWAVIAFQTAEAPVGWRDAALVRLAAGLSHEFNNLLTVVLTEADRLAEDVPRDRVDGLRDLRAAASHGQALARQLAAFAEPAPAGTRPVPLADLIDEASRRTAPRCPRGVHVETALEPGLPRLTGDPQRLAEVLDQLLSNAFGALADRSGGTVRISASATPGAHGDRSVVVLVEDDGPGLPDGPPERVFEPFFTTRRLGRGTGLGLTTARAIVEGHGGHLTAERGATGGARFVLTLPAAADPDPVEATEEPPPPRAAARQVWVVDDDHVVGRSIARTLRKLGIHTEVFVDPREARRALAQLGRPVDLVLIDVDMPHIDGITLASEFRRVRPELELVLMSGNPEVLATLLGSAETDSVLAKPLTVDRLRGLVHA
jgi:signal transduction histidine kinase